MLKCKNFIGMAVVSVFMFVQAGFSAMADGSDLPVAANTDEKSGYGDVTAKSAIVMEASTGEILYEKNSTEKMPASYLVKLMTLLEVEKAVKAGKFNYQTMQTTSSYANSMGDPQIWLNAGEKITTDELIKSITVGNANDGCVVLAEAVSSSEQAFVNLMNSSAEKMGLENTKFVNCTGIEAKGQYSSARDIGVIAGKLLNYSDLEPYFLTWMLNIRNGQTELVSTNKLIKTYNGITGMKAASSNEAGNCLVATARRGNLNLVCVLLGSSTPDSRFAEAKQLLNTAFAENQMFIPKVPEESLVPIRVKNGQITKAEVERQGFSGIVIKRGTSKDVSVKVEKEEMLNAPVLKGQCIGKIQYYIKDKLVFEENLVVKNDVPKTNVKFAFLTLLKKLLKF